MGKPRDVVEETVESTINAVAPSLMLILGFHHVDSGCPFVIQHQSGGVVIVVQQLSFAQEGVSEDS